MKLLRSKRVGPQRRPGGFSSVPMAGRCLRLPDPQGRRRRCLSPVPGALLPGGALTTDWVGSLDSPVGRWPSSPFGGRWSLQPAGRWVRAARSRISERVRPRFGGGPGPPDEAAVRNWSGLSSVPTARACGPSPGSCPRTDSLGSVRRVGRPPDPS